ncbi:MAG: thioredoxin family protein [Deltaproteobacteria bacterium]|nr:MAG: thioredoxin family protein [Deltaproteobacteria bacterium]
MTESGESLVRNTFFRISAIGIPMPMPDRLEDHERTPQDLATARITLAALESPLVIKVIRTRHPLSGQFSRFIEDLAIISDNLKPIYLTEATDRPPTIEPQPNLRYLALPIGRELDPFLSYLSSKASGRTLLTERSLSALDGFITPTRVEVMMSPTCPFCPVVVGFGCQLALASTYLEVNIIDISRFTSYAERNGIRAVPTVVINDQDQLTGQVTEATLVDRLAKPLLSVSHPDTFKKIVKEGGAERLAEMMVAEGEVYSKALELLADSDWSVRMGMMVVLEEVAARKSDLVRRTYPYLKVLLGHQDANIRGDTAYLLGRIGDFSVLDRLQPLHSDPNPEVAEAALEAAKRILRRSPASQTDM